MTGATGRAKPPTYLCPHTGRIRHWLAVWLEDWLEADKSIRENADDLADEIRAEFAAALADSSPVPSVSITFADGTHALWVLDDDGAADRAAAAVQSVAGKPDSIGG